MEAPFRLSTYDFRLADYPRGNRPRARAGLSSWCDPAAALALLGAPLTIYGIAGMPNPTRQRVDIVAWLRGFRLLVTGLGVCLFGIAWFQNLPWLLVIALAAGLQEIRESTSYPLTLDKAKRWAKSR